LGLIGDGFHRPDALPVFQHSVKARNLSTDSNHGNAPQSLLIYTGCEVTSQLCSLNIISVLWGNTLYCV